MIESFVEEDCNTKLSVKKIQIVKFPSLVIVYILHTLQPQENSNDTNLCLIVNEYTKVPVDASKRHLQYVKTMNMNSPKTYEYGGAYHSIN